MSNIIYPELKPLRPDLVTAVIGQNISASEDFGFPTIDLTPAPANAAVKVAIIAPGDTVKAFLPQIESFEGKKVIAGSGHRLLNQNLLAAADAAVFNLPIGVDAADVAPPRAGMTYYVASNCPPAFFEHLQSHESDVRVYNAYVRDEIDFGDEPAIGTGGGAGNAAVAVMAAMGYREFEMYGVDGSTKYAPDISDLPTYAASLQKPEEQVVVRIDGKTCAMRHRFWEQTQELMDFMEAHPEIKIHFHGDSLNAMIFNTPDGKPRRDYEIVKGWELPPPEPMGMT